jgi:hypothetical protein
MEQATEKIYQELSNKALSKFNASIDHVPEDEQDFYRDIILQVAYGMEVGDVHKNLLKNIPEDRDSAGSWGKELIDSSSNNLSKRYQEYIFRDLKADDYQEMAEIYMPQNFERTGELLEQDAFQLWLKTYQHGLLTQGDMDEFSNAYSKKEDFEKNKKTKEDIADMFGFNVEDKLEQYKPKEVQKEDQLKDILPELISNGLIPTVKDEFGNEYIKGPNGALLPKDTFLKQLNPEKQENYDLSQDTDSPVNLISEPELEKVA